VTSNPIALSKYKATNILFETNKKYEVSKIAKLIIKSYKSFLSNLKNYDYSKFKKKSEIMAL
jgi:predicted transcriptional regulator